MCCCFFSDGPTALCDRRFFHPCAILLLSRHQHGCAHAPLLGRLPAAAPDRAIVQNHRFQVCWHPIDVFVDRPN